MLARTLGLILLASTFAVYAFAGTSGQGEKIFADGEKLMASEESCGDVIDNHKRLVEGSEEYFAKVFASSEAEFTPNDITVAQKVLKVRYEHLLKVLSKLQSPSDCNMPGLGRVVAVYDFNILAESTMDNPTARRTIHSFTKASDYGMKSFKEEYNYFTREKNIESIFKSLTRQEVGLLDMFGLAQSPEQSGIRSSTTIDKIKRIWGWTLGKGVIRTWGVVSDTLKVRHGYLRDSKDIRASVRSSLKPLDILFEQRRFVLSSLTIPGNWGHTAVWLGTKPELQAMGLWDRQDFAAFRKNIELGKNIVQMRKEGVVFSTLEEFMNLDEVAVMRVNKVQIDPASVYPLMAEQLNKSYDFSFDARTLGKITCTEFISFSFGDIKWPTHVQMGRLVISPDDIAKLSLDSTQAQLIMYVGSDSGKPQIKTVKDWFNVINPQN
ncbi:hypothetical protein CIK05_05230 [Bdellovibrio sp. qaytius]|nr:hypothetical protein CIK05_05230 [Bdellovibrio sp. qaytius]